VTRCLWSACFAALREGTSTALRYRTGRALGYSRYNISVRDFSHPTLDQLEQFAKLVDGLPRGTKMIVHCEGGTGRTGTLAAAYWITKGMTASEAIMHVRKVRWRAVETPEQEAVLVEFATRIRRRSWTPRCCSAASRKSPYAALSFSGGCQLSEGFSALSTIMTSP
jgi:Dual specificity phosphatase, catalytic domain